ncbi:unnamed protein product [Chrysoparadoxa australica]
MLISGTCSILRRNFCTRRGGMGRAVRGTLDQLSDNTPIEAPTFLAQPRVAAVVGAPMEFGQPLAGTDKGPTLLRNAGLIKSLAGLGWRVEDSGDIEMHNLPVGGANPELCGGAALHSKAVGEGCRRLAEITAKKATEGRLVLTLGGDHSVSMGSLAGVLKARPNTGVIWVDAHADLNVPATSPSGNMHGMPLGLVTRLVDPTSIAGFEWMTEEYPHLPPNKVAYIGLRDVDDTERRVLKEQKKKGMFVSTMQDIDKQGIGPVVQQAIESLGAIESLHLSFDVDAVDPQWAPATGTVVRGGLTYREAHYCAEAAAETGKLGSVDIVEVNAEVGSSEQAQQTVDLGLVITLSAMGSRIL